MKIKDIGLLIILSCFLSFIVFHVRYNYINIKVQQSYYYYNMIDSLKINDNISCRFYAKQILKSSYKTIYYDLAFLLLYEELKVKKKNKKIVYFCEKIIKKKKLGLINVSEECNKILYKNTK